MVQWAELRQAETDLLNELVVLQAFPCFHHTDNGCLDMQFAVFSHIVQCLVNLLKVCNFKVSVCKTLHFMWQKH